MTREQYIELRKTLTNPTEIDELDDQFQKQQQEENNK